jgi:beta-phosphoglucomutase-like phosphatase (HAD superfamily)
MDSVMKKRPELTELFDAILMSEDFEFSKPHPDCYIKGAHRFGAKPEQCLVFEDSFNGLKSGRASGAIVVGLSTSNSEEAIKEYCDIVIPNYKGIDYNSLIARLSTI